MNVASVAGGFPSGPRSARRAAAGDRARSSQLGADEIDIVLNRSLFLGGRYAECFEELVAAREAAGGAHLKVILETGELGSYDRIRQASVLAMAAGADFIKTSTGKIGDERHAARGALHDGGGARLPPRDRPPRRRQGRRRDPHVEARDPVPGARCTRRSAPEWMTPDLFRIGASTLLNDVLMQITRNGPAATRAPTTSRSTDDDDIETPSGDRRAPAAGRCRSGSTPSAPESTRHRPARGPLRAVRRRRVRGARRAGRWFETIDPATEESLAEVAEAGARGRRARGDRRARGVRSGTWGATCPARERAKYLYRIARQLQERAREFAVLETMNGGKPIKESRDVDLPLAAAHFFYYAGWADKLEYAFPGRRAAAARRRGPDHPVELPAADGGVEARARPGDGQHRRAQARGDHAAHRAVARRGDPGRRASARGREHRHRGGGDRRRPSSSHPGVDKMAFTGSTEVGKADPPGHRGDAASG